MKSKKNLAIMFSIIAIVIILVATIAILFFATDIFKSDKELFLKYVSKYNEYVSIFELENEIAGNGKYLTEGEISFDLTSKNEEIANQSIPARNFKVSYSLKEDKDLDRTYNEATLKYINENLFVLKYLRNADTFAIKSDEVINKYMGFENNNLQEYAKKLGVTTAEKIPNKIEINIDELKYINEEDKNEIINKYLNVLDSNIPDTSYSKQKNINLEINERTSIANLYKVKLNSEQIYNIEKGLLETLLQDDKTLNLIASKIKMIDNNSQITIENLKENVQELLNNVKQDINQYIEINIYEANKELVKIEYVDNNGKVSAILEKTENAKRITITNDYNYNIEQTGNITIKTIEIAKQILDNNSNTVVIIALNTKDNKAIKISNQLKTTKNENTINKEDIINVNIAEETYFNANIKQSTKKVETLDVEELNSSNSVKINDWSLEYTIQLFNAIGARLNQLFEQKMQYIVQVQRQETETNTNQDNNMINTIIQ